MKEKMLMAVIGVNSDVIEEIDQAEIRLNRIMKFDIDNYLAKQNQIEEYELENEFNELETLFGDEDQLEVTSMAATPAESSSWFPNLFQAYADKTEEFDEYLSGKMEKIRADYKDVSFLQLYICCNLAIFSLAASIFWLFYKPPGHHQVAGKKMQKDQIVSIPVDFENMKVPKKQIKKQLKSLIKGKPNTKESML